MFPSIDLQAGPGENETDVDEAEDTSSPSSCQGRHTVVASAPDTEDYNDYSSNDENTDDSESCRTMVVKGMRSSAPDRRCL